MKILASTAAVCIVIGLSIFTTQKTIEAEGRRTRSSMPGVLNNPLSDGESLISKLDNLNANLSSINKRLSRLEDISSRQNKADNSEFKEISAKISTEIGRMTARLDAQSAEQKALKGVPAQLQTIDRNMRIALLDKENDARSALSAAPSKEIVETLDWMVRKIDDIDSYFTPLYTFLGAVYTGKEGGGRTDYPSIDKRLNQVILQLDSLQKDMTATLRHVSPYVREPAKRPRPFDGE